MTTTESKPPDPAAASPNPTGAGTAADRRREPAAYAPLDLPPTRLGRVSQGTVLAVASAGALLAFLDVTIVNVAFPNLRNSFSGATIGSLSWVLNAYNIVLAAFLIVFGRLSDLIGRRRLYILGTALFTLASAACAIAPSVGVLVGFRILQALGAAMLIPASLGLVVEAFPRDHRAHAVSLWGAVGAVAAGLGPPAGGALVELGGWRWAFWVNVPLGIVSVLSARHWLVESRSGGVRRIPDLLGALLLAGCLGLVATALVKAPDWGVGSGTFLAVAAGAVVMLAAFVVSSRRARSPLLDPALLTARPFVVANVATIVAGAGFYAYMLVHVLWLQYVWQYSVLRAGLALAPGALVAAVTAALLGPLAERRGYRLVIIPGALVWAAAFLWYVERVGVRPAFLTEWLPGQVLSGIGVGATLPLLGSVALAAVPGARYATASAVASSARQIGGVLGISVVVILIGSPTATTIVGLLRDGWRFSVICFVLTAAVAVLTGVVTAKDEEPLEGSGSAGRVVLPDGTSYAASGAAAEGSGNAAAPAAADGEGGGEPARGGAVPPPSSIHDELPPATRQELAASGVRRVVPAGDWIVREGDEADSMFLLTSGRAEVVVDDTVVRELGPGAVIGELALLTGGHRSASVRARRDSEVIEVSRELWQSSVQSNPAAVSALVTTIAHQLASVRPAPSASSNASTPPAVVAVVPGGSRPGAAQIREVAAVLAEGLSAHGRVTVLDPSRAPRLDEAERENDWVVLVADGSDRDGIDFAVRQADRIVVVATCDGDPAPLARTTSHRPDLVLIGRRPERTAYAAWTAALDPWRVSTVEADRLGSGLRPLVDRLAGRSVGVVLSGGGARATAHAGVLMELEDAGIEVDRVAGASIGAILGVVYATGISAGELAERCYASLVRTRPFSDYTLPRAGLARGVRQRRVLAQNLGDLLIEELPRGFQCVSTDLRTRATVVHRSGNAVDAAAASSRLPVLFPPVISDGRLLVDGGVLDNLPVHLLTERDEGPVVAINIAMGGGDRPRSSTVRMPSVGETLLRTLMINGGDTDRAVTSGAYVVSPSSQGVGLLEFHQLDRMVAAGRAAARELLEATGGDLHDGWRTPSHRQA